MAREIKFRAWNGSKIEEEVGTEFDTIGDIPMCKKYEIPMKGANLNGDKIGRKPKVSRLIDGQVHLHVDTERLDKNIYRINPDDDITITYKVHGCLPSKQKVKMWEGKSKKICEIKKGDVVVGFNHVENKFIPSVVKDSFITGKTEKWLVINKTNSKFDLGAAQERLVCTEEHGIYCPILKKYKKAKDFKVGDKIISNKNIVEYSDDIKSFLIGKVLGDAHVDRHNKTWAVSFGHKNSHEEYIDYCLKVMANISNGTKSKRVSGYGTRIIGVRSKQNYKINLMFSSWFKTGIKQIPEKIKLNPIILAFWYMDDGSLTSTPLQKDRANFATCDFSKKSMDNLKLSLKKYGFNNFTIYKTEGYYRLRLNASDAEKLFSDIAYLIPPGMQYKLPIKYRNKFKPRINSYSYKTYFPLIETIISISEKKVKRQRKHDIETSTHNFVSGGMLIHNSSGWVSHVLVKRRLNIIEKILKTVGVKIDDKEYDYVYGSRKIVKNANMRENNTNFYDCDIWAEVKDEFRDLLPKGYTIYYEIVGFTKGGGAIQPKYDYGCKQGEKKVFVYRITVTNNDGNVIDLSSTQIKEFCDRVGINYVPVLFSGKAREVVSLPARIDRKEFDIMKGDSVDFWRNLFVKELTGKHTDKDCYMCVNKVPEEGIVLRKESLFGFESYKMKSFRFLEYETKMLDEGVVDMESAN